MKWSLPRQRPADGVTITREPDGRVELRIYAPKGGRWTSLVMDAAQRKNLIARLQRFDDPHDDGTERRQGPRRLA